MIARRRLSAAVLCCCLVVLPAFAQEPADPNQGPPPANLAYIEGHVDFVHEGLVERAVAPAMLLDGDIVRTRDGRAEIVFSDGTILHLDRDTDLEFLSPERLRLLNGRTILRVSAATPRYVVDTPASSVRLDARGEYGIATDAQRGHLDLTVARGLAEIDDGGQRVIIRAGERLSMPGPGARGVIETYNSARWDAFDRWSNDRTNGFASAASARQLPSELRAYGPVLDQGGQWDYLEPYGYVWYPTVSVGWRPYYDGSWAYTRYGWTWYGRDRWAWPTHHYGRWGFTGAAWYWIPARTWGAAWVSWAYTPGYVSWCPLGWDGYPVGRFWGYGGNPIYRPGYSPWRAWTVVPRDQFGPRGAVRRIAVDGDRLDERARQALIDQNIGPSRPVTGAVPRGTLTESRPLGPVTPGAVERGSLDSPRPGSVRRPGAVVDPARVDVPRMAAPIRPIVPASPVTPLGDRGAISRTGIAPISPPRGFDDPPAIERRRVAPTDTSRGADNDAAGAYRRRGTAPSYLPPSLSPPASGESGSDRSARPRGVREPSRPAPPESASRPSSSESRSGAARRGGESRGPAPGANPPSAPAAREGGARRRGGD